MGDTDQGGPVTDERVNVARIIDGHDGARAALDQPQPDDHLRRAGRPVPRRCAAAWPRLGVGRRRPRRRRSAATATRSSSPTSPSSASAPSPSRSTRPARRPSCSASWPPSTPSPSSSTAARPVTWRRVDRAALADDPARHHRRRRRHRRRASRSTSCSAASRCPSPASHPDHVAALMFTSGTAGSPRAAMLTHGNLLANIEQARSVPDRVSATDVVYGVIPAYHIFGLNVVLGLSLSVGRDHRARPALRSGDGAGVDPRPQGDGDPRHAVDVGRLRPLRRGAGRRLRHGAPGAVRRGEAAGGGVRAAAAERSASASPRATA